MTILILICAFVGGFIGVLLPTLAVVGSRAWMHDVARDVESLKRRVDRIDGDRSRVDTHQAILTALIGPVSCSPYNIRRDPIEGLLTQLDRAYHRPVRGLDKTIAEAITRHRDGGEDA